MRANRRVFLFLVAALTTAFIAAGIGAVRLYLPPLANQASRETARPEVVGDELPSACREELATMNNSPANASRNPGEFDRGNPVRRQSDLTVGGAGHLSPPDRASYDDGSGRLPNGQGNIDQAPVQPPHGSDANARPINSYNSRPEIARARSAEWNAPATAVATTCPARTVTLPVSVEEAVPSQTLDSLRAVDVLDLMRRLRSDAEAQRISARRELLRRGFSEVDLELARQLFSPDVAVRKQLALAVPRLASVDAVRWLMWLAADPQPEVRMAAITTLATTGDPQVLDRVEALARKDSDQQIQALGDQIAKQRDLALHPGGTNPLR